MECNLSSCNGVEKYFVSGWVYLRSMVCISGASPRICEWLSNPRGAKMLWNARTPSATRLPLHVCIAFFAAIGLWGRAGLASDRFIIFLLSFMIDLASGISGRHIPWSHGPRVVSHMQYA